jgi:uncharacterized protein
MNQQSHDSSSPNPIVLFSINHPKIISWLMALSTTIVLLLATLPNFWPEVMAPLPAIKIDTDPENMLSAEEPVRIYHNKMKKEFSLSDIVVVGITNDKNPNGVFNPQTLSHIYAITQFARRLNWPDPEHSGKTAGVIEIDIIAPSTVDYIEQGGLGSVNFSWLMPKPPETVEEALLVRQRAANIPFLKGTLLSDDGKAIALYLPLTDKHLSHDIREKLLAKIAEFGESEENYYITGLPVAEDTFGVEMFYQMAISAPLAMLVILLLLWWFFKRFIFIVSPMIVAMVCALSTMAILIISGNTIHIMSSMIPIFIMPIAVLDAIHILSDFFDRYGDIQDRRKTLLHVMQELFAPMLYTTLTTVAGFGSLALTPIPPVQVFGIFIAVGVLLAWFWTVTFIPAFIMFIPEHKLASFCKSSADENKTLMSRSLEKLGSFTYRHALLIIVVTAISAGIAGYGIKQININDNPIKWFTESHPIRVADRVLNAHFGGTYMAYLVLEAGQNEQGTDFKFTLLNRLAQKQQQMLNDEIPATNKVMNELQAIIEQNATTTAELMEKLSLRVAQALDTASDEEFDAWDEAQLFLDSERQRHEIFKQPEALNYLSKLQNHINSQNNVGKSNSLADVVKTVHRELLLGRHEEFRIPDSSNAVAQTLITYQNSHRPHDLWHFVTPDYRKTSLWLQLKSGDNQDMSAVEEAVNNFIADNPPPYNIQTNWFGLTHINVAWQEKMVFGMLEAFSGSYIVVLIMMIVLFRSLMWGLISMVPLTVTVGLIYGIIGLIGKDYDMPVAVLSSLSIGLAVDYAIHFLSRAREYSKKYGSWKQAVKPLFNEPARAITRNAIVVGVGFLPLLAAPLVPYQTVGIFIAAILLMAGISSLLILPAIITLMDRWLFRKLYKSA